MLLFFWIGDSMPSISFRLIQSCNHFILIVPFMIYFIFLWVVINYESWSAPVWGTAVVILVCPANRVSATWLLQATNPMIFTVCNRPYMRSSLRLSRNNYRWNEEIMWKKICKKGTLPSQMRFSTMPDVASQTLRATRLVHVKRLL